MSAVDIIKLTASRKAIVMGSVAVIIVLTAFGRIIMT